MEAIINIIIYIVFDESGGGTLSLAGHQGINALFENSYLMNTRVW